MLRRELLKWFLRLTGGYFALSMSPPLTRINTTLFSEAHAQEPCTQDTCTTQDNCGATDTVGHTCEVKDVCDLDASGNCKNDECQSDKSGGCQTDSCESDKSGSCANDTCTSDTSGGCQTDSCESDSSGACINDTCTSDKSGACTNDTCTSDKSGSCANDSCISDKSGGCQTDSCESDNSDVCTNDTCTSDTSGACKTDSCESDSSYSCINDTCTSDSSGSCTGDNCGADAGGACPIDRCNSDYSGTCSQKDVCVLDVSTSCDSDICREDRSPVPCATDTCSFDLASNTATSRRHFAKAGINEAIKWLYKLSAIILFIGYAYGSADAATVIDATNAVFSPNPSYVTSGSVNVPSPVGQFLRDCDNDGVLEADTNGDGQCAGDPEVLDYDNDGTKELPPGTLFTGDFQFTCFHIPSDVAIVATGPLTIKASQEVAVFGVLRLASGANISSPSMLDLRTSAWLSEDGSAITFTTSLAGDVDETQTAYASDATVPPIAFTSVCGQPGSFDYYCDDDNDGYIDSSIDGTCTGSGCVPSGCQTTQGDDCDDSAPTINPGATEVCDGVDNDCDGTVDEGCACINGDTRSCGSDTGECVSGTETCVNGAWSEVCDGEVGPQAEVCDNLDNDCDGSTDESLTRPTTCGVGACSGNTGVETCTAGAWGGDTCDPLAGATTETCNNIDDDCDGSIDEDIPAVPTTCGVGVCQSTGQLVCVNGSPQDTCTPGTPGTEGPAGDATCSDTIDNDCDGTTDAGDSNCVTLNLPDLTGQWTSMAVKQVTTTTEIKWVAYGNLRVTNQSNVNAGSFVIKFYFVPSIGGSPQLLEQRSYLGLLKGATTNIAFRKQYTSNPSGTGSIRAVIDANNTVIESNETNNEATRSIP